MMISCTCSVRIDFGHVTRRVYLLIRINLSMRRLSREVSLLGRSLRCFERPVPRFFISLRVSFGILMILVFHSVNISCPRSIPTPYISALMIIHESSYNIRLETTSNMSIDNELDDVKDAIRKVD